MRQRARLPVTWLLRWLRPNCWIALSALQGSSSVMWQRRRWLATLQCQAGSRQAVRVTPPQHRGCGRHTCCPPARRQPAGSSTSPSQQPQQQPQHQPQHQQQRLALALAASPRLTACLPAG